MSKIYITDIFQKGIATSNCISYDVAYDFKIGSILEADPLPLVVVTKTSCLQSKVVNILPLPPFFFGWNDTGTGWEAIPIIYRKNRRAIDCSADSCRVGCVGAPDGFCCIDHSLTNRLLAQIRSSPPSINI